MLECENSAMRAPASGGDRRRAAATRQSYQPHVFGVPTQQHRRGTSRLPQGSSRQQCGSFPMMYRGGTRCSSFARHFQKRFPCSTETPTRESNPKGVQNCIGGLSKMTLSKGRVEGSATRHRDEDLDTSALQNRRLSSPTAAHRHY